MPAPQTIIEQHEISSRVWNEARWHDGRSAVLTVDPEGRPLVGPGVPSDEDRAAGLRYADVAQIYTWEEVDAIMRDSKVFGTPREG